MDVMPIKYFNYGFDMFVLVQNFMATVIMYRKDTIWMTVQVIIPNLFASVFLHTDRLCNPTYCFFGGIILKLLGMHSSCNFVNVTQNSVNVYLCIFTIMAISNKMQIVLSHNNSIIVSNGQQPLWCQLGSHQWSLFVRLSLNDSASCVNLVLHCWLPRLILHF